jgi:hypothetical protein
MNAIRIIVEQATIETKEGRSRKTGKDYRIDEQPAFVTLPNGEKRRVTMQHEEGDQALPAGEYEPKPSAYWVGDFGALSISTRAKHWQKVASAETRPATAKAA